MSDDKIEKLNAIAADQTPETLRELAAFWEIFRAADQHRRDTAATGDDLDNIPETVGNLPTHERAVITTLRIMTPAARAALSDMLDIFGIATDLDTPTGAP